MTLRQKLPCRTRQLPNQQSRDVEHAIRPVALGRKNYLFAGSDAGGIRAAQIYTLIRTAKPNGLEPEACLRDIPARIGEHPINHVDELLPWTWLATTDAVKLAA